MNIDEKLKEASSRIESAFNKLKPIAVFGLFSGGHDSFSACACLSASSLPIKKYLHLDTGTGVKATRTFVEETCSTRGWDLTIKEARNYIRADGSPDPQIYEDIVMKWGFPGPGAHRTMYIRLKERGLNIIEREFGANCRGNNKNRIMFISGCRSQESQRRMGNTKGVQVDGRRIWVSPIHDWSKLDTTLLMEHVNQKRNPVVDLIHKSGECLCGAFAKKGELDELLMWPLTREAGERIVNLQKIVTPKFGWGWEGCPKRPKPTKTPKCNSGQTLQLCWNCLINQSE